MAGSLHARRSPGRDSPREPGHRERYGRCDDCDQRCPASHNQPIRRLAARLSALITARSEARTIDSLMPTPQYTRSPISISR